MSDVFDEDRPFPSGGAETVVYRQYAVERLRHAVTCLASAQRWITSSQDYMDDRPATLEPTTEDALQYIEDAAGAVRAVMKRLED